MRCILHIGTEKTATTLIQKWLYENYDNLSEQGVALTKECGYPNNRKLVSYFQDGVDDYLKSKGVQDGVDKDSYFNNFEERLSDEISNLKKGHSTLIISSEHFHSRLRSVEQIERLKKLLDRFFDDYKVVCYFREQSKVRTSLYSTTVKVNNEVGILDFQNDITTHSHYYNYFSLFKKWERVFGKDALIPRLFVKDKMLDGDIRKDIMHSSLPTVDTSKLNFETVMANESLSADEAHVFTSINAARDAFSGPFSDPTPNLLKSVVRKLDFLDHETGISDPRQVEMYEQFNDVNVDFFSEYFGEKRNLFPKPSNIEVERSRETSFSVSDISQVFSRILSIDKLVVLGASEVDLLRDLAERLYSEGAISKEEALVLLSLAVRARPKGGKIIAKINEIRKLS